MKAARWMEQNLATQGYCLSDDQASRLRVGLRFPTALCLALVIAALALQSAADDGSAGARRASAGWTSRHPFDYIWNHGARHLVGGPKLPPNPPRRRHSFKLATVWLAAVSVLFAADAETAGLALGSALVAACGLVTVTSFCVPSTILAWLETRRRDEVPA